MGVQLGRDALTLGDVPRDADEGWSAVPVSAHHAGFDLDHIAVCTEERQCVLVGLAVDHCGDCFHRLCPRLCGVSHPHRLAA